MWSNARAQALKARPACCTFRRRLLCVNDAVGIGRIGSALH